MMSRHQRGLRLSPKSRKRPHQRQQQKCRNQNGAGEVTLKIRVFEELQSADLRADLSQPIKWRREQGAEQHHTQKISNDLSCGGQEARN